MALAVRSSIFIAGGSTVTEPAGASATDILVAFVIGPTANTAPPTTTGTWVQDVSRTYNTASEVITTWTLNRGAVAPNLTWGGSVWGTIIWAITGADQTTWVDAAGTSLDNATSTTPSSPSITTVTANALILTGLANWLNPVITAPAGVTQDQNSASTGFAAGHFIQVVAGATPTQQWTMASTDVSGTFTMAIRPAGGVVASQPPEQDWLEEELGDDWSEWQFDSTSSAANAAVNNLLSNQFEWDFSFDDTIEEDTTWQYESEPRKTNFNNPPVGFQDSLEILDEVIDDELWHVIDDGFNVRNANAVASVTFPVDDGWYHEDDIDDDWYLDEYLSISASVQVAFLPDDSFAHFDEFVEDEYLLDEFQQVTQQDQPTDLIYDFDDVLDDDWFYDQSINQNLVLNFVAPFPDEWDWFEEVSDEWTVDEVLLINTSVVILYTNPRFIVVAKIRSLSVATVSRTLKIIASARFLKVTAQPQQRTVVASSRKYKV